MTLESQTGRVRYIGNGTTQTFSFNFKVWKTNQVQVFVGDGSVESNVTSQVSTSLSPSGGSVYFKNAPENGKIILIKRNMPYIQEDNYENGARFDGNEVEDRFDQDCAERQDLKTNISRAIVPPETSDTTSAQIWKNLEDSIEAADAATSNANAAAGEARQAVGWLKDFIANKPEGDVSLNSVTAWNSFEQRTLADRFADFVNVKDFGAKGDGATDDTDAVASADAFASATGKTVYFPDGGYVVEDIIASASWYMSHDARLLKNADTDRPVVTFNSSGKHHGHIWIDAQGNQATEMMRVYGDNCVFDGIHLMNLTGEDVLSRGLYVTCDNSVFKDIRLDNFVNTGHENRSVPQGICLSGDANGNNFDLIVANNCRATVCVNSTGKNHYGNVLSYNAKDNGFYAFREGGVSSVDSLYYDGDDNALGVRHRASVYIDTVKIARVNSNALFFGNIGSVFIDTIYSNIDREDLVLLAIDDTLEGETLATNGDITINNVFGKVGVLAYFPDTKYGLAQKIGSFTINNVDVSTVFDLTNESSTVERYNFINLNACDEIHLGRFNIKVFVKGVVSLHIICPVEDALVRRSTVDKVIVRFYDYTTKGLRSLDDAFFIRNIAQQKLVCRAGLIRFQSGHLMLSNDIDDYENLYVSEPPTAGTYRTGQVLWRSSPSSNVAGYICLAGGTPGTWGTIAYS